MKKRLLSALLALVMVLAMLPATAFAADDTSGNPPADSSQTDSTQADSTQQGNQDNTQQDAPVNGQDTTLTPSPNAARATNPAVGTAVEYKYQNNAGTNTSKGLSGVIEGAPGWYAKETADGITTYTKIASGVIVSNKYQGTTASVSSGTATVVGSGTVNATGTNLTVDLYPDENGSSSATVTGAKLTNLTVTDSKYFGQNEVRTDKGTVTLSSAFDATKAQTLKLVNTQLSTWAPSDNNAHTLEMDNAEIGDVTLSGVQGDNKADTKQIIRMTNTSGIRRANEIGAISVTGNNAEVTLSDVGGIAPTVTLDGTTTKLNISGNSSIGKVTLKDHLTANNASTQLSTVTVEGGSSVASIVTDAAAHAGKVKVDVKKGAFVTNDGIDLTTANTGLTIAADVDITEATVSNIKVSGGTVDVKGPSTVSTALEMSGATTLRVTDTGSTINGITATGTQVSIDVPANPDNTFDIGTNGLDTYVPSSKIKAIAGGTWTSPVPAAALSTTLVYQLSDNGKYTYYTVDQLATALTAQERSSGAAVLCRTADNANAGNSYDLVFMNGKTRWGTMKVYGEIQIKLPTAVTGVTVTKWADARRSYDAGGMYPTPAITDVGTGNNWEINASGGVTSGDITKFTGVTTTWNTSGTDNMGTVKGTLNGTVITLTGAVPKGDSSMTLKLTTDAVEKDAVDASKEVPVELSVRVNYFSGTKSLVFANVATDLGHGATLETDANGLTTLRLSNGLKYTLNGSGLKERSNKIQVADVTKTGFSNYSFIEVNVQGISSTYRTLQAQQEIVDLIKGQDNTADGSFTWTNSPAMLEALNAALATITDANVDSYIANAQRAAWQKRNTGSYNAATNGPATGYDTVWLVPYLQVNLTNYVPGTTATATLVPSWRVEVRQSDSTTYADYAQVFADNKKFDQPANAFIAKAGTSLGQLSGEFGNVLFKPAGVFIENTPAAGGNVFMHQDSTYAYRNTNTGYKITHASTNGLGTVVFNKTVPLVELYVSKDPTAVLVARYNTLQAAVDDAKDGQHISVDQNYKGSMTINVTGTARTFTIQAHGNNVVVANASGGLVTLNNTGGLYTVQLTRDATAVGGTTADISVASGITNGTVTLSTTRAKANTKVEVTTTPAAGYLTRNLTATARTADNKNTTVAVTKTADNKYTFTVPTGATSITVTPTFAINTGMPFTDVEASDPYFEAVKYVYEHNPQLMNGMTATSFGGYGTITRGQVVTILYRLSGSPSVSSYSGFTDVNTSKYYAAPITWARNNGIVDGYGTTFGPEDPITREQLAKILHDYSVFRGLNVSKTTSLNGYTDAGYVHSWALEGMQWSVANGIVGGTTTTTLSPGNSAQRYHAATMLMRYCKQYGL